MATPLLFLAVAVGLSLLAGTFRSIKLNLIRQPAARMRKVTIELFEMLEWCLWFLCPIALIAAAPHPITILLVALFVVSVITAGRLRYREETQSLNRWLQLAPSTAASIPVLVESLADGFRSRLARQAKTFVIRVSRGESIVDATRRSRLPLDADTLANILLPGSEPDHQPKPLQNEISSAVELSDSRDQWCREQESARLNTLLFQQATYLVVTLILAWLLGLLIRSLVVPSIDHMLREFTAKTYVEKTSLNLVALIADCFLFVVAVWLFSGWVISQLPLWMVRWVPWFGRHAINRWRSDVLGMLARAIRSHQPASDVFQLAAGATRVQWIRKRCRTAHRFVESGISLPNAMQQAKLISAREEKWLTLAQANGNLASAIEQLVGRIDRVQTLRWRIRIAWLVPLVTVLVGAFVLVHAMYVFNFLFAMITGLS
ncbi:type II secretion system F family protein [Neorhodopirellula lusitana]|uniref:type II secretion system F family protein n=1 Tax=Neorhodopirellula lusitana TaxID=445327 RepID=UPI00384D1D6D